MAVIWWCFTGQGGGYGRTGSLLLLTGTLQTTMLKGSIALRCTVRPGRIQTQTDYIICGLKSGQADSATGTAHAVHSWKLRHLKKWPTRTSTRVMFLLGDPGPERPGGSLNKQNSGSLYFPGVTKAKSRHCVGPPHPLTRPPGSLGFCGQVTVLTFFKGSCMESYHELTVLLSRPSKEFQNLCSTPLPIKKY